MRVWWFIGLPWWLAIPVLFFELAIKLIYWFIVLLVLVIIYISRAIAASRH
jgi:hypothetical protein